MTTVATNLLGRWVRGRHVYQNPDYVFPENPFSYSRKQMRDLTDHQRSFWTSRDVEGQVVAVTQEGSELDAALRFWILIDGRACVLSNAIVMPPNWTPAIR